MEGDSQIRDDSESFCYLIGIWGIGMRGIDLSSAKAKIKSCAAMTL